jgi:hypothetical protein
MQELIAQEHAGDSTKISETKRLIVEIHHPSVPTIDLIDMPGLEPSEAAATLRLLEAHYEADKQSGGNCLYLLVIPAPRDTAELDLDTAARFIKTDEGRQARTLGVFTKCDRLVNDFEFLGRVVNDDSEALNGLKVEHGWIATRSLDCSKGPGEVASSVPWLAREGTLQMPDAERLLVNSGQELKFFRENEFDRDCVLKTLLEKEQATCVALVKKIKAIYMEYLEKTWAAKTFQKVYERTCELQFDEKTKCGKTLSENAGKKNDEGRTEVKARLDHHLPTVMAHFIKDHVKPLRNELQATLQKMHDEGRQLKPEAVSQHFTVHSEALKQLLRSKLDSVQTFWMEQVRSVLAAEFKVKIQGGAEIEIELVGNGTSLWNWFKKPVSRRFLVEEVLTKPRMQLHAYPDFIEKLMSKLKGELDKCRRNMERELNALQKVIFENPELLFVDCVPSPECDHVAINVQVATIVNRVVTVFLRHGPCSEHPAICNLQIGVDMGSEVENCKRDREEIHKEIKRLTDARSSIQEMFKLEEATVKAMEDKCTRIFSSCSSETTNGLDTEGCLHWIGTKEGSEAYQNPHQLGLTGVSWSSGGCCSVNNCIDHKHNGCNVHTNNASQSWVLIDLRNYRLFAPTHYCLRHGYSGTNQRLQHWKLQASHNNSDWVDLKKHENEPMPPSYYCRDWPLDNSQWADAPAIDYRGHVTVVGNGDSGDGHIGQGGSAGSAATSKQLKVTFGDGSSDWFDLSSLVATTDSSGPISAEVRRDGFRFLRVQMTDTNTDGNWHLAMAGFEIYGRIVDTAS